MYHNVMFIQMPWLEFVNMQRVQSELSELRADWVMHVTTGTPKTCENHHHADDNMSRM